jgi:hypothetical protein
MVFDVSIQRFGIPASNPLRVVALPTHQRTRPPAAEAGQSQYLITIKGTEKA